MERQQMEVLPSSNIFAIFPEQERVILFDYISDRFIIVHSVDNTHLYSPLTYDKFRTISGSFEWLVAKTVKREQRVFLFALIVEVRSSRMYLISYEICLAKAHMILVQEHYLHIKSYKMKSFSCDLLISERERLGYGKGELHCVFHYLHEEAENDYVTSHFSIVCVHIDNFGHIHSKKLFKDFIAINGHWRIPFMIDDRIYSIIGDHVPEKMAEIQMSTDISDDPIVTVSRLRPHQSATGAFPSQTKWTRPIVGADSALWYVFDKRTDCGECWKLNMRTKQWAKLWEIDANQHAVSHNLALEFRSPSSVMLHGECCNTSCKKPHIHSIQSQAVIGEPVQLIENRRSGVSESDQLESSAGHQFDMATPVPSVSCVSAEVEADENRCTCVACMENLPNVLFLPCKHLVLCLNCSNRAGGHCPFCRSTILHKISGCFLPA